MIRRILRGAKCTKPKEPSAACGLSFQCQLKTLKRF